MNWKQFKTWLDKNIIKSEELTVKIRTEKQGEYGELSTATLTNFCDSLDATLDNNDSYHLFPQFAEEKEFRRIFNYQNCYFGKKTNQNLISEIDYHLLEKLFQEWKVTQNDINKKNIAMNTRNIILMGRTGSGKSTLANVLVGENKFAVGGGSVSKTKNIEEGTFEVDLKKDGSEKIKYRVIDTIGIGDTNLTPQGVLMRLAQIAGRVKREGLNQILFVTRGRFTKEEVEAYDLLSSIIFDKNVIKYTTIVRTGFEDFEDKDICEEDKEALKMENEDLTHIIRHVKVVYVDNPPLKGRSATTNKLIREESRKRLIIHLGTCEENYRPSNIDTLDERVNEYKTNEEKLTKKLEELEKNRKEEREKFLKEMEELKKKQAEELKRMEEENKRNIHNVREESKENLQKVKSEMETNHKKEIDNLKQENKERVNELKSSYEREAQSLKSSLESQVKSLQEQNRQARENEERLLKQLQETKTSSASEISKALTNFKSSNDEIKKKELDIQEKEMKSRQKREDEIHQEQLKMMKSKREAKEKKAQQEEERREIQNRKEVASLIEKSTRDLFFGWK